MLKLSLKLPHAPINLVQKKKKTFSIKSSKFQVTFSNIISLLLVYFRNCKR